MTVPIRFFQAGCIPGASRETMRESVILNRARRGVAQPGSVLAWGASGRPFKSARPDQNIEC